MKRSTSLSRHYLTGTGWMRACLGNVVGYCHPLNRHIKGKTLYHALCTPSLRGVSMASLMMASVAAFSLLSPNMAHADERLQLLVMGDSLSAAYNMERDQGWVALLAERLGDDAEVINASVSGETTSGGTQRFPALLRQHEPDMVLLELGGNDGLRGLSPTQMHDNLADMIEHSLAINAEVILLGMDIPPNYGKAYRDAFKDVFTQLADHYDVPLVPFLLKGIALNDSLMQSDAIHPKAEAQPMIVENVWPVLAPRVERLLAQQTAN